jgi:hypothetical protein
MKFYKDKVNKYYYWFKIINNKLTAIHYDRSTRFMKNGIFHNNKNAAIIYCSSYKEFSLNDKKYGNENTFTKQSWRRFVKLQAFL